MTGIIIYLVTSLLVSLIFIALGVNQFRSKVPVALNTGEVPPREDELTDMSEWNHKHGRNLIIYGCALFITLSVFIYFLEKFDGTVFQMVIFFIVIFGETAWLEVQHSLLKKKLIKKPGI
ncbi:MAG: hypothetical protein NC243_10325 [Lachnoclostridium sp.]|nr:hypothetical protein [Lachnoclostridium sp.]MCM1384927.1 hypothetical protein [Lachnoclostridium sp.]